MSTPPTSGPTAPATAIAAEFSPIHFPRSAGGKRSAMIANAVAAVAPCPMPAMARDAISCGMSCAAPESNAAVT